jgi:energy-coupling factor transporter ATP-binding protein EcfA2
MTAFHDHLGLQNRKFDQMRCVVFTGRSGAGKSTYLNMLATRALDNAEITRIEAGRPLDWPEKDAVRTEWVLVDELLKLSDLKQLASLLRAGHRALVASHLPRSMHFPLRLFGPLDVFSAEGHTDKLARALAERNVIFAKQDLVLFKRRFGGSYADLDMVLAEAPGLPLGDALRHFKRRCSVTVERRLDIR